MCIVLYFSTTVFVVSLVKVHCQVLQIETCAGYSPVNSNRDVGAESIKLGMQCLLHNAALTVSIPGWVCVLMCAHVC